MQSVFSVFVLQKYICGKFRVFSVSLASKNMFVTNSECFECLQTENVVKMF